MIIRLEAAQAIVAHYHADPLDCLVCLEGGGTMKNALRLQQAGLNIVTRPKTIDNDVALTDTIANRSALNPLRHYQSVRYTNANDLTKKVVLSGAVGA